MSNQPDYLPAPIRAWIQEHQPLLEAVAGAFVETGEWAEIGGMTKAFIRAGQPVMVREIFWEMPRPLGGVEHNPDRVRLTLFALGATTAAQPLLEQYMALVRLAVERYPEDDDSSVIAASDVERLAGPGTGRMAALAEVVKSQSPFLGNFTSTETEEWVSPITEGIVPYWEAETIGQYLTIRATQLANNPQFGWGYGAYAAAGQANEPDVEASESEVADSASIDTTALSVDVAHGASDWEIGEPLGEGGFGKVFLAVSEDRNGVIKLVPKAPGAQREMLFVGLEGVPNVVPIWDSGEHGDFWFLVMPRAEMSLRQRLADADTLDVPETISVMSDVAEALVALDGHVVHRDLKPENILLLDRKWCLADFGISRYAEATTATETQKWALTPQYAAPERWRGEHATIATDVYSLGIIGFELLTGRRPFECTTFEDYREAHLHAEPPAPLGAPAALTAIIAECLYKASAARPSPANVLARLPNAAEAPISAGLRLLEEASQAETNRRSQVTREQSVAQTAAERRAELRRTAQQSLTLIADETLAALLERAPSAQTEREPDTGAWVMTLGQAELSLRALREPQPLNGFDLDLIAVSDIELRIPQQQDGYHGRAHSLWFADAQTKGEYRWFETAFILSAFIPQMAHRAPSALDGDRDAVLALAPGVHTYHVAWPFTPLTLGDLSAFVDRWAGWFAEGSLGRLQRPPGPVPEAPGSWRR